MPTPNDVKCDYTPVCYLLSPDWKGGDKWYKFEGSAGSKTPKVVPPLNSCGTGNPGWLTETNALGGGHPSIADGVVTGTACFHTPTDTCQFSLNIELSIVIPTIFTSWRNPKVVLFVIVAIE